ncbi:MAG: hypothetical protein IT200_10940 [Thermoleophilia bacterium]|nr:hypothetical protein [Thermoleophilia bacterium]
MIRRDRVVDEIGRAAEGHRILDVVGSAGSGKTTAMVQYLASRSGPAAWLTLGEADGSPGRLVTYLAAALDEVVPDGLEHTLARLAARVSPADCASMLAEALPAGAALVIDDLHSIEARPPALAVLRAFTGAVAPGALVVLASRRPIHDVSRSVLDGTAARLTGDALAFTEQEIATLLDAHDVEAEPQEVARASGGWAAGIVFDAIRGRPAAGDPEDPFFAYLGAEVLAPIPPDVRAAVVTGAVLDIVEPQALAVLLDVPSADALYRAILHQHLPATIEPEGLRYHPRFREFLLSLLEDDPGTRREVLLRDGRRMRARGQMEEAADRFLEAGAPEDAAPCIEEAGSAVVLRGDWEKAQRWCCDLGEELLSRRPGLRAVQLEAVLAGGRHELPALAARLVASGEYARLAAQRPHAAVAAAFGVHLCGDWSAAARLLPRDEAGPAFRASRYVYEVGASSAPPRPWPEPEWPADRADLGMLECGLYFQGRFLEVEAIHVGAREPVAATPFFRIDALRELGRLGDARARLEATRASITAHSWREFFLHADGELTFAEGDRDGGLALVREAREVARSRAHQPADRAIFAATEGKMLVRMGRAHEAAAVLDDAMTWSHARGLPCFWETAATWRAAARLSDGEDPAAAIRLLRTAITGMDRAERRLEQPAAQVLLAEACWRQGDEDGHDAAADRALEVSEEMGSLSPLLVALADHPDVLARRIDAGGPRESDWRRLARAGDPPRVSGSGAGARVLIGTLGRPRIEVDGADVEVRPARAIDVAAEIARSGRRGVPRARLVAMLEEHSGDAQNYLRQIIHRLRRIAPEGVELQSADGVLRWSPAGAVTAEDDVLSALLAQAFRDTGDARDRTLRTALELADRGPMVACADDRAALGRRDELAGAVAEARREHARLLLAAGRAVEALATARAAAAAEPLREDGWYLAMQAAAAADGPAAALPVYAECAASLAEVGLQPSPGIRELLRRLRGAGRRVSPPAAGRNAAWSARGARAGRAPAGGSRPV